MVRFLLLLCLMVVVLGAAPLNALREPTAEELDYGRRKIEVWRQYPEALAKLRQAAQMFVTLSVERQRQLDQLDHELHAKPPAEQARLHDVLDRYTQWLNNLPEKDRARVLNASDKNARLAILREMRQGEWLRRQPKVTREQAASLQGADRDAFLAKTRAEERLKQAEWTNARRFWDEMSKNKPLPAKLLDFDQTVQTYVSDVLSRLLSKEERDRLAKAEGQWPQYPQVLVELADKHPPALPSPDGPRSMANLPKAVRDSIGKKGIPQKKVKDFEGRFPDFAMKLTSVAHESGWIMPLEWWPCNFNGLLPPMQEFLKKKLEPLLERKESRLLVEAEGRWPEYPETIQKLAQAHNVSAPWFVLPGPRERWDVYRANKPPTAPGFPELAKYKLRDFVEYDLDDLDRGKLKNELERARTKHDNEGWAYLVDLYFQRYPSELNRLRNIDREKLGVK